MEVSVIKKSIFQIMLFVVTCLVITTLVTNWNSTQLFKLESSRQIKQFSLLSSQVDRLIEQLDWRDEMPVQLLVSQLSAMPEVMRWEITNSKGKILDNFVRQSSTSQDSLNSKIFYVSFRDKNNSSNNINVQLIAHFQLISPNTPSSFVSPVIFMSLLLLSLLTLAVLYYKLEWVMKLEKYSKLILTADDNRLLKSRNKFQNIIGHAISQLILNNSYLVQSKSDLTKQIRQTTYIDETTELGNHLFFKAELQVRLHNHDEVESGLVVILSFLESSAESQELSKQHQILISQQLKRFVEPVENSIVARLKESEFALLMPNFTSDQTDQFCKKLIKDLSKYAFEKNEETHHFVDIGISTYKQGFDYYHVMAEADLALRNAQLQGANTWYVYGEPLPANQSKGSLRWKSFLGNVLEQRKISLFRQKVHYFDDRASSHYEILARIQDGDDILSAETFLAMAHQCGLSADFDRQIIGEVIKQAVFEDRAHNGSLTSINLFVPSLLNAQFSDWLIGKISSYPELAKCLVFEVSENLLRKNISAVRDPIIQLSQLGVRWCIEHFASIGEDQQYMLDLPISIVKVDRRIINDVSNVPAQQLLLSSIIVSLKNRNIEVLAEGVEKSSDKSFIEEADMQGAQGYLFDTPKALKHN